MDGPELREQLPDHLESTIQVPSLGSVEEVELLFTSKEQVSLLPNSDIPHQEPLDELLVQALLRATHPM